MLLHLDSRNGKIPPGGEEDLKQIFDFIENTLRKYVFLQGCFSIRIEFSILRASLRKTPYGGMDISPKFFQFNAIPLDKQKKRNLFLSLEVYCEKIRRTWSEIRNRHKGLHLRSISQVSNSRLLRSNSVEGHFPESDLTKSQS